MKIFGTVTEYLPIAKQNDVVIFGGTGIMDGLSSLSSKHDTYRVQEGTTVDKLSIKSFRGKKTLTMGAYFHQQQIAVLTKDEFKSLPVLW